MGQFLVEAKVSFYIEVDNNTNKYDESEIVSFAKDYAFDANWQADDFEYEIIKENN